MRICDLKDEYPLIYEKAVEYHKDTCARDGENQNFETHLISAFGWDDTIEGSDFWVAINRKEFKKAEKICPHLFESKKESIEDYIPFYIQAAQYDIRWERYIKWLSNYCKKNIIGNDTSGRYGIVKKNVILYDYKDDKIRGRKITLDQWEQLINNETNNQNNGRISKTNTEKKQFSENNFCSGKSCKIDRLVPTITRGQRPTGNVVGGRTRKAAIESRPLSYRARIITS